MTIPEALRLLAVAAVTLLLAVVWHRDAWKRKE